jgi:hypothetical protein
LAPLLCTEESELEYASGITSRVEVFGIAPAKAAPKQLQELFPELYQTIPVLESREFEQFSR